jgi:hypothetical protein
MNDKFNLGLGFPNLPYLLNGDFKITESMAILPIYEISLLLSSTEETPENKL